MSKLAPTHRGAAARTKLADIERALDAAPLTAVRLAAAPLTAVRLAALMGVLPRTAAGFLADLKAEGRARVRCAKAPGRTSPVHVYFTARTPEGSVEEAVEAIETARVA